MSSDKEEKEGSELYWIYPSPRQWEINNAGASTIHHSFRSNEGMERRLVQWLLATLVVVLIGKGKEGPWPVA